MVLIQYPSNAEIKAGHNLPIFTRLTFGASSKKALSSGVFYKSFPESFCPHHRKLNLT